MIPPDFLPLDGTARAARMIRLALRLLLASTLLCVLPEPLIAQGTLQTLRSDVRNGAASETPQRGASRERETDSDDDLTLSGALGRFVGTSLLVAATSPFWGPPWLMGDDGTPGYFPNHPYQSDHPGYIIPSPLLIDTNYFGARLRGEYGDDFSGLSRASGHVLLDTAWRWGIDSEITFRHEKLVEAMSDELWTGDFNVVRAFSQNERLQLRAGLGVNWLEDRVGSDFGFNFTYAGDFFPRDPWIISAEMDWGRLGNASLFHLRSTVGVQFQGFEIYAGYDYFDVGRADSSNVISGIRLWF